MLIIMYTVANYAKVVDILCHSLAMHKAHQSDYQLPASHIHKHYVCVAFAQ